MESLIKELREKKILCKDDIDELRNYIAERNPDADNKRRASLLSYAIYSIIDSNLNGFSHKHREQIKKELVQVLINQNEGAIYKADILYACSNLQQDSEELLDNLTKWLNNNLQNSVKNEDVNEYIACATDLEYRDDVINRVNKNYNDLKEKFIDYFTTVYKKKEKKTILVVSITIIFTLMIFSRFITTESVFNLSIFGKSKKNNIEILYNSHNIIPPETIESIPQNSSTQSMLYFLHIPDSLRYKALDREKLREYLMYRNSLLADEPYFTDIIKTAEEFGINPNVLFAITGQEQGFVPKHHEYAYDIANNPFNVFGSWTRYNTNIKDSSEIAARTVCNLLIDKPEDLNPFKWINRKYAEDENWWKGVNELYNKLENAVE